MSGVPWWKNCLMASTGRLSCFRSLYPRHSALYHARVHYATPQCTMTRHSCITKTIGSFPSGQWNPGRLQWQFDIAYVSTHKPHTMLTAKQRKQSAEVHVCPGHCVRITCTVLLVQFTLIIVLHNVITHWMWLASSEPVSPKRCIAFWRSRVVEMRERREGDREKPFPLGVAVLTIRRSPHVGVFIKHSVNIDARSKQRDCAPRRQVSLIASKCRFKYLHSGILAPIPHHLQIALLSLIHVYRNIWSMHTRSYGWNEATVPLNLEADLMYNEEKLRPQILYC